jgi:SAM-dependent methyltransferase
MARVQVPIEKFIPNPFVNRYRRLRSSLKNSRFGKDNAAVFDKIYVSGAWGADGRTDLYSGPGSYEESVEDYVEFVREFISKYQLRSIVEIGCGDFSIASRYAAMVDSYLGVDVSSIVVDRNAKRYGSETINFVQADASKTDLPASDLCIIRQVLQHLDNETIAAMLRRTRAHRFVLVTEHLPSQERLRRANENKRTGPDTRLHFGSGVYVELPPFDCRAETVLSLPVTAVQEHAGEIMRTSLIVNEAS